MKAVIIGNYPLTRTVLKSILENEEITVMYEASHKLNAIQLVESFQPEMVIMDAILSDSHIIEMTSSFRSNNYQGIIIVVSGENNIFHGKCSLRAGANAYIGKKKAMENIVAAIQALKLGYNYFPLSSNNPNSFANKIDSLSEQEFKIMRYVLSGAHNIDIADKMLINHKTVSTYKRRLMFKLNCRTLKDLFMLVNNN